MNFFPQTREEAVAQYVAVALERRKHTIGGISRQVARKALKKAKRIKVASDWKSEVCSGM